eukprot:COSAG02_NODE_335_length_24359_cov_282.817354_17_plen_461_part_00
MAADRVGWQFDWATYHAHIKDGDDTAANLERDGDKPGFWVPTKNAVRTGLGGWKAGDQGNGQVVAKTDAEMDEFEERVSHPLPDDPVWMRPPLQATKGVATFKASKFDVNIRARVNKLCNVDTLTGTAQIVVTLYMYWNDPRMIGYPYSTLPDKLWGPMLILQNRHAGDSGERVQQCFQRYEVGRYFQKGDPCVQSGEKKHGDPWPDTGRMIRVVQYFGLVDAPMSNIREFPFDLHEVNLKWLSLSTWQTLDMQKSGFRISGSAYRLRYIVKHPVADGSMLRPWKLGWRTPWPDGKVLTLLWDGLLAEWQCLGISREIFIFPKLKHAAERITFDLTFHLVREPGYYLSKVLVPIILLTVLSFGMFFFPVEDFHTRLSFTMSCFLSTFAMLYVVGAALPKGLGVLTNIDWMIMITIFTITLQVPPELVHSFLHKQPRGTLTLLPWVLILLTGYNLMSCVPV